MHTCTIRRTLFFLVLLTGQSLFAQHTNILIGIDNDPNEPSICINPKNTQELVAGANLRNLYYSHDGGINWTQTATNCPWGIWGDPAFGVDTTGAFYYCHLSNTGGTGWIDRIITQKSTDKGVSWSSGSYTGLNGLKDQDKHWIATDWRTNRLYLTWTQFDHYDSHEPTDSSIILFSSSSDGGITWATPKRINQLSGDCLDSDLTAEGAVPCVGPNGQVYVAWSNRNKIWFDRSLDGGATWLAEDIFVGDQPEGWDYSIPGIYRANGLPVTTCDTSGGAYNGTIYINWSDQRNGESDTDIWLSKSTDGGNTWSPAKRVNDDNTDRQQFFTWMTIDQATGWLWFVFYDRRNYSDNNTDVYMAVSTDGGETFKNFQVSESPFDPFSDVFFGDYTNITAHNNVVRPIWTRLDGSQLSVWTALVQSPQVVTAHEPVDAGAIFSLENPFPNPSVAETAFSFKLRQRALVNLSLLDMQGNFITTLIDHEWRDYGKYIERMDPKKLGLKPGMYLIALNVDGKVAKKKVVMLEGGY